MPKSYIATSSLLTRNPAQGLQAASLRTFYDSQIGQAVIETALCLPILLLITFGLCTFGIAFSNDLMLTDATNVGARQLAISRGQTSDPCSTVSSSIIAAAPTLVKANLAFSYSIDGVAYSGTTCTGATTYMVQGATAEVTATYPCSLVSFRWRFSSTCLLSTSTTELIQ